MLEFETKWFHDVPKEWKLNKIGQLFNVRNVKVSDKVFPPLSVSKGGVVPQMESVAKSDASDDRKLVMKGDFAINSRSDRKQSCGVSLFDGSVSLINIIMYPKIEGSIYNDYLNFLLKNYGFAEEFYRWGHGIVADLWTTRWQEMKNILLPVPSYSIQIMINNHLKSKIKELDLLIKIENKQIEKLSEYKTQKIVELYESYKCEFDRISNVCDMLRGPFGSDMKRSLFVEKNFDTYKVYAQINCIENNETLGDGYITKEYYGEMSRFAIEPNDILVTCDGTLGKILKLSSNCESGVIGSSLMRVRLLNNIVFEYFKYVWEYIVLPSFLSEVRNSCLQHLPSASKLGKFTIKVPSVSEQLKIIKQFDDVAVTIDKLIAIKNQKITKLEEYKKSLIYEYVTGKKEVIA